MKKKKATKSKVKMDPKKQTAAGQNALTKARSALKKAEHAKTPLSIKRKLESKKKEKKS